MCQFCFVTHWQASKHRKCRWYWSMCQFCHWQALNVSFLSAQEVSVILKYVPVLLLTGFERVTPVSTGNVGDAILKYVSVLLLTGFERVPPVSRGSVGDNDVSFVTDRLWTTCPSCQYRKCRWYWCQFCHWQALNVSFLSAQKYNTEVCVNFVTERLWTCPSCQHRKCRWYWSMCQCTWRSARSRACQQGSDNSILVLRDCHNDSSVLMTGTGIAQWLARRTRDWKVAGSNPLQERRENVLLQGRLSVLTLISLSVPPPCYRSST